MTQRQLVGEIAAHSLAAVRVFEDHGIDYCCGGQRALEDACREKGLDPAAILTELETAQATPAAERDWTSAKLHDLIDHILRTHHDYLKRELPRLSERMATVGRVYADRYPDIVKPLARVLAALRDELEMHLRKEEMILFPFVQRAEAAADSGQPPTPPPFGSFANPISVMEDEHETAGRALAEMRRLTNGYLAPADACNTFRALYAGLEELERDLHMHIHLENNVLFPRAIAM